MKKFLLVCVLFPFVLQAEFLPSITDTIYPQKWLYSGPFSIAVREGVVGVLDYVEGFTPKEGTELPSELVPGGQVSWKLVAPDSLGVITFDHKDVMWDDIQNIYGYSGTMSTSYVWGSFNNQGRKRGLAVVTGAGGFRLNDKQYPAGIYHGGADYIKVPVIIEDGENRVFLSTGGKFTFKIIPVDAPIITLNDYTMHIK